MKKKKMSNKLQVLHALKKKKYWYPTLVELSKDLKIPTSTVHYIVFNLMKEGRLNVKVTVLSDLELYEKNQKKK